MEIFLYIILAFLALYLVYLTLYCVKTEIAFRNHMKILDAAYDYACDTKNYDMFTRITDKMESMEETTRRWRDFGCKNIVPKVYYEMIEPYIR